MKIELNTCFILHTRPYLESSLLLDIFSREYGRLNLIAKGVRRKKPRFLPELRPYQRLLMAWFGKSELMNLTDVEADLEPYELSGKKIFSGFYLNELLTRLLHQHESHPELFDLYEEALSCLSSTEDSDAILRIFEKGLLRYLGYGLVLDHDIKDSQVIESDSRYYYVINAGPTKYPPDTDHYIEISGNGLLSLEKEIFEKKQALQEAKYLLRFVLKRYLGDKPLASRALYKSYMENLNT